MQNALLHYRHLETVSLQQHRKCQRECKCKVAEKKMPILIIKFGKETQFAVQYAVNCLKTKIIARNNIE